MACDAEDCGFQMLSDDEIVTSVNEESNPVDDEMDEDEENNNNESSKGPSNADAFSTLETAMGWYEQQSECCPTQLFLEKTKVYNGTAKNKLLFSTIKVTARISSVKFPEGMVDGDTIYLHLHNIDMELMGREIFSSPCTRDSAHKTFGPTDLTSTYSVCTRRVFGGIGHRTHVFRSGVRCSNH
ncbi:uncharacterized protein TNCV_2422131 [Trichonephila clavipes]|nr:uncharacterized protein TNCV_2422131 [Trichonephila clavipes]